MAIERIGIKHKIFWFWAYLMKVILSVPDEGYFEGTWWRLFWAYLMKVILSVPDEGYFERTWWRLFWAYLMKVIMSVPDEGYYEHTWWRLLWAYLMKVILSVPDEGCFERTWSSSSSSRMKVIPETRRVHYIWYLRFISMYWSVYCSCN